MKHIYILIIYCLLAAACTHTTSNKLPDENILEDLLNTNPDSLASILEEKINPLLLSDADKADYGWWLTETLIKQHRSLVNDTLIHFTAVYYEKTGSPRTIQAYIWAARQSNWSGTTPLQQREMLEKALEIADNSQDTLMINEICFQIFRFYNMPKDAGKLRKLAELTKKYRSNDLNTFSNYNLLNLYNRLGEDELFFSLAPIAIETAYTENNFFLYPMVRTYVDALNVKGRHTEALQQLKKLEEQTEVGNELKLNYINTFISMGQMDSARIYIDAMQPLIEEYRGYEDIDLVELTLKIFEVAINLKEGKNIDIFSFGYIVDNILTKGRSRVAADSERQRTQSRLVEDNLKLDIERGQLKQRFLVAGILVLIMVAVIIFIYQRKLLKKERSVQKAKEQLHLRSLQLSENESVIAENEQLIKALSVQLDESGDLKQEIDQLTENNEALKQENKTLQKDIDHYSHQMDKKDKKFAVYDKLTQENARLQERERFLTIQVIGHTEVLSRLSRKPRFIEEMQWSEIFQAVNQLFDGFTYRLHTDFPALTEEDIRYCCLIKLHLTTSVISTLTGISPSSVTKRKQRIKEKMAAQQYRPEEIRKEQSLEIYLWNY